MPLPFNKSLDLKLIKLVKENNILYNSKHAKYLDFDSREVVWQKIGDALGRPALVCKSRWINMRDMMRRKVRDRLRNPNQRVYNYKYEEELSFMLPYFKDSTTTSEDYTSFLETSAEDCDIEMPAEVFVDGTEFESDRDMKPNITTMKRKEQEHHEIYQDLNPADPLDVFLITIGTTLRKFSPYYLNQAKSKIFQVVQDYELQQIVNKDDQPTDTNR
ncbi:Transcription factor Adf-1 [Papilio xuthus]|uniref:Transcription factor Adf-1 n=1 Tax=Papilio xuthus TaxID=66420 RepID=A0A194PQK6_PAPXU|nr:Transcription factor Adf-1 [Papilio xuthus]